MTVNYSCCECKHNNCTTGNLEGCLNKDIESDSSVSKYNAPDSKERDIMIASERVKRDIGLKITRIESILAFIEFLNVKRVGIVTCTTTLNEARQFQRILEAKHIQSVCVACKIGKVTKHSVGLPCSDKQQVMCNPALQAKALELEKTQLNVMMGLCVGHDTLFFKHTKTPTTVLFTKDHITGHNAVQPLYVLDTEFRHILGANISLNDSQEPLHQEVQL